MNSIKKRKHDVKIFCAVALMAGVVCSPAHGQGTDYPNRPIRMLVGFTAGGGTDSVARVMSQRFSEVLGQSVVIDNRAGAGGNIAAQIAAKSSADGYTMHLVPSSFATNPSLYSNAGYDPVRDFITVTTVATTPYVIEVNNALPAKTVREFIAYAKSKPGQLNYASGGTGTPSHLAMELFKTMAGIDLVHVPYKGGGLALTDLIAGHVAIYVDPIILAMQFVQSGKTRALAVTTPRRAEVLPNVPTAAEAGLPGYDVTGWYGIVVPATTPKPVVDKIQTATRRVLDTPEVRERFKTFGLDPAASTPDEFSRFMRAEIVKWSKVIKDSGAKVD